MKKAYILSVFGLVALGILIWFASYFSTGTIIVTPSNKSSTITLQKTSGGKPFVRIGLGSLSATVKHGQYMATVKSGSQASVQVINFNNGHKTLRYSVKLSDLKPVEPVLYQNAKDLAIDNTGLYYLNATNNYLYKIDMSDNLSKVDSTRQFQSVKWANLSYGVGKDSNGHLFVINSGSISPLGVPFSYSSAAVNFDVAPNQQIYISNGADVYSGNQNGGFKKIYTSSASKPVLAASADQVAVADETEDQAASGASKPLLVIVNTSGKITKKNIEAGNLVWSPNGQYLVSFAQASATIYNTSLDQVATLPASSNIGSLKWLDNDSLFYSTNNQLWMYNLPNQSAELIANMPLANSITDLSASTDKSYVYMVTVSPGGNSTIRRIGLQGQQVSSTLTSLGNVLPIVLNDESLSLVNFGNLPPSILIQPFPDSNLTQQNYIKEAQTAMGQYGFDLSKLQFKIRPVPGQN